MSAVDEILASLPIDQLAAETGADPREVQQAAAAALPALLGGLGANAQDPRGAASILDALGQHQDDLLAGGVDLAQVDSGDGTRITEHIFGPNQDQVVDRLGASGLGGAGGSSMGGQLIKRLLPILAPIVLSWLANKVLKGGGGGLSLPGQQAPSQPTQTPPARTPSGGSQGGPGSLEDLLKDVLGGAAGSVPTQQAPPQQPQQKQGGGIMDILGDLLGGGRR